MLNHTNDVQSPTLRLGRLVAQRLEWDADFDFIAVFGDASFRLKDEVLTQIGLLPRTHLTHKAARCLAIRLENGAVHLHAEWIHSENECLTTVVEGAQQDLDLVVGVDAIAIG